MRRPRTHLMKTRSDQTLVQNLRELIAALDRRIPRPDRVGEAAIARDAHGLRQAALKHIGELESAPCGHAIDAVGQETV